jgi:hypothetical protein
MERSRLYKLIERGLGEDFEALVAARRQYEYSWAALAREISDRSEIEVSDETLRRWFDTEASGRAA